MTDRKPLWTKEEREARIALLSPQDRELLEAKVRELEARAGVAS
jgi:hypothetical protein